MGEKHGKGNSAMLWRMIQGLKVKCDGRQRGCCSWTGELGDYFEHLNSGTCGTAVQSPESNAAAQEETVLVDAIKDEVPPSPSTCSECSHEVDPAEESGLDTESNESYSETFRDPVEPFDDPVHSEEEKPEQDLTSLIRSLVDLKVNEYERETEVYPV